MLYILIALVDPMLNVEHGRVYIRMSLWHIKSEDVFRLETWPQERNMLIARLQSNVHMPNVLCDIIIAYSGSSYGDALVILGGSNNLEELVDSCKSHDRLSLQSAQAIISLLARTVGSPPPIVYKRAQIRDTVSNIGKFRAYPDHVANLKRCAIFHRILLTYF